MGEGIAEENQKRQKDVTERAAVATFGQKGNAVKQRNKENVYRIHRLRIIARRHAKHATNATLIKNRIKTLFWNHFGLKLSMYISIRSSDYSIQH